MSDSPAHKVVGSVAKVPVDVVVRVLDLVAGVLTHAANFVTGLIADVSAPFRGPSS